MSMPDKAVLDRMAELERRVTDLENVVAPLLEPEPGGLEKQHEEFVARVRARKGKA